MDVTELTVHELQEKLKTSFCNSIKRRSKKTSTRD